MAAPLRGNYHGLEQELRRRIATRRRQRQTARALTAIGIGCLIGLAVWVAFEVALWSQTGVVP